MKKHLLSLLLLLASSFAFSQYTTSNVNGIIGINEYGTNTDGQNKQGNWYVTWDASNLYIGLTGSSISEGAVFYIDRNPIVPVNGGANTDGTLVGSNYDGTNFSNLPFRADFVTYFKDGSREYRTANGSNGWSSSTTSFGTYDDNGFTIRELSIPWSAMGGLPSSFNFFGYSTNSSGNVYNQQPAANPSGSIGTSATANYYFTVSNTANGTATKPFSRPSFATNATTTLNNSQNLWDFTVNGSSITTTLSAMQNVSGAVAVASGNTLAAGGNLTLVSTATGTARIATISNDIGSITGNVTCQLYIPGGSRRFRLLSHPFNSNRPLNMLGTSVSYTGFQGTTNGFSHNTSTNNPSVFKWFRALANGGSPDAGWFAISNATQNNATNGWQRNIAIRILIRGAFNEGLLGETYTPSAVTLSMTSVLNTFSASFNLLSPGPGTGTTANFVLLGNPFAAPFNIGQAVTVNASNFNTADNIRRLTNTIYIRVPSTGNYATIDLSLNPNYTIPAYCGFFGVVNTGNTQVANDFLFSVSDIATAETNSNSPFSEEVNKQQYFELQTLENGEVYDNMYVKFDKVYSSIFNSNEDGGKMINDVINTYTLSSDNTRLANNCTPFEDGKTIALGITQPSGKRNLQFKISSYHLAANQQVMLVDKLLNTRTILDKDVVYNFEIDNANAASVGDNRFALELQAAKVQAIGETLPTANSFTAKLIGSNLIGNNDVQVQIANPTKATTSVRMVNFLGQAMATVQGSQAEQQSITLATNKLQAGKYFIEVVCGNEKQMISVVKN